MNIDRRGKVDKEDKQNSLVITPVDQPTITVDNEEVNIC